MTPHTTSTLARLFALSATLWLAGCDIPGLGPDPRIAQREEEAKAVGGACRHAMRGLEDCYAQNPKSSKAAVFTGWKEMDQYMRENNIQGVPPAPPPPEESEERKPTVETEPREAASGSARN
jgi:hypothetical protein